jgi:glycosyltransferase involved in cell wall biosynthesis
LPPIAKEPLTVLVLADNNAAQVDGVVRAWLALLDTLPNEYEIVLVDDRSTDGTAALALALADRHPRLRVLSLPAPLGPGAALRTGLAAARFPLLLQTTCDHQYRPEDLKIFLERIDLVHLVSGFRKSAPVPTVLRWLGLVIRGLVRVVCGETLEPLPGWLGWASHRRRWLARILFGVRNLDVDCEFRLFRRSIFARIPIQSNGPFTQVEVLAKANFLGCMLTEEPVSHQPTSGKLLVADRASRRQYRREVLRLLRHPDFGPPVLPQPPREEPGRGQKEVASPPEQGQAAPKTEAPAPG